MDGNQRKKFTRAMATYAAMVDELDQGVGRVMDALEKSGRADNTLVVFLSDNGAWRGNRPFQRGWAQLANTPFRQYKKETHEGGIRSPLIMHWPKGLQQKGVTRSAPAHIVDVFATCMEAAGATAPKTRKGKPVKSRDSRSLLAAARGQEQFKGRVLGFEHECNRGLRRHPYKLVARGEKGPWELYDLTKDPTELNDLAAAKPELRDEMIALWNKWADENQVLPLDGRGWGQKIRASRAARRGSGQGNEGRKKRKRRRRRGRRRRDGQQQAQVAPLRNLAKGAKAKCSSTHKKRFAADKAVDGVASDASRWVSKEADRSWLELDLGAPRNVASAHVYTGWQDGSQNTAFHFEAAQGSRFVVVPGSKVQANRKQFVAVRFAKRVRTSRLRLVVTDGKRARIREVALWSRPEVPANTGITTGKKSVLRPTVDDGAHIVALNQIGYDTLDPKRFTAPHSPDGSTFRVVRVKDRKTVFTDVVRSRCGDFTRFQPEGAEDYVIVVEGEGKKSCESDSFRVAANLVAEQHWQPAVDFMVDCRSVTGTHPSAFGGCPWRDATYYSFEVPSLVMMLLADEQRVRAMPKQIDWSADRKRVMAASFPFDKKNPGSKLVMQTTRSYYAKLKAPKADAPDAVKLIHWGLGYYLFDPDTKDPSNDPLPRQIHSQTVEQFAFALYAWPKLKEWLNQKFHDRCLALVEKHWESSGSLGIDPLWEPKSWKPPVKSGDDYSIGRKLHPYKGRHCPGHSILPNLLMHEVATRLKRKNAARYLRAAVKQTKWVVANIDWQDPRASKGQRQSEHKLIHGLVWMLQRYPQHAPKGLRASLTKWAEVVVTRSGNMWDFRRYDDTHWTIPKLNETGNVAGFPGCAAAVMLVLEDTTLKTRLAEISQAHIDSLFGRNPMLAAAPNIPKMGFPLVERGWPKAHKKNVCARLELVRGALSASPGSEMFPFNPAGKFRHAEGWCAFNATWNTTLAVLASARRGKLPFAE